MLCEDFVVRILASDDFLAKGKACKYAHSHNTVCGGICQLGVGTSYRCVDTGGLSVICRWPWCQASLVFWSV